MPKKWLIAEPITSEIQKQFPEFDRVVLQLLWNRGQQSQEQMDVFLGPDWSRDTYDPALFLNMHTAVQRVFRALNEGEVITIHGDYDADGTCGTAVLFITLRDVCRSFGFDESKITTYIPHREKEGYGLSIPTIEQLSSHDKTTVVITVDCGISNKSAIDRGKELGIDTIVCDHHAMPVELPDATLIHPQVPGETFPNKYLCGTGVAFKLASALISEARAQGAELPEGFEKWLLDLVAIATVTDVVPLTGENRVLETYGLRVLNKTRRIGIRKLLDVAGSTLGELDTVSIGFQIGPRLNAAGRMTHAQEALALLIEEDEVEASKLAMRLQEINVERQKASQEMYLEAKAQLGDVTGLSLLVAVQEGWGAGLVGLVAGKLLGDFGIPVFVVGKEGDRYVGSGRSIEGFDITQALHHAKDYLDKFGGHPQACGFSSHGNERFEHAVEMMKRYAAEHIDAQTLEPTIQADAQISLEDISWELFDAVQKFRPFGSGNATPLFVSRQVHVSSFATVGKEGAHLKLGLESQTGKRVEAIGFRFGEWTQKLTLGCAIDIVFEIQVNEWNGNRSLQIRIVDLQLL
ncbi:single-stranded-DNA-specific exonuclease RecJ [Candidatus Uhrbacteria bacterium]|nr:single-stranded-DNA-specific exonuclease RecJ [Candidatus Uhrbacteria bacterium]